MKHVVAHPPRACALVGATLLLLVTGALFATAAEAARIGTCLSGNARFRWICVKGSTTKPLIVRAETAGTGAQARVHFTRTGGDDFEIGGNCRAEAMDDDGAITAASCPTLRMSNLIVAGSNLADTIDIRGVQPFPGPRPRPTVVGGLDGDDFIVGAQASERLLGGDGDDRILSRGGADLVEGGEGADRLQALDNNRTEVSCGAGDDLAIVDLQLDVLDATCERATGFATDADTDGYAEGVDCDDDDRGRHPAAVDRPGNLEDENCDGEDEFLPVLPARLDWSYEAAGANAKRLTRLVVRAVEDADRVRQRCLGRGCPRALARSFAVPSRADRLDLTDRVRGLRFRRGARLRYTVIGEGHVGKMLILRFRGSRPPVLRARCVRPGVRGLSRC